MNGDGRSDVCCVDNNGDFQCWLNMPSGGDAQVSDWQPTGYLMKDSGFTGAQVSSHATALSNESIANL